MKSPFWNAVLKQMQGEEMRFNVTDMTKQLGEMVKDNGFEGIYVPPNSGTEPIPVVSVICTYQEALVDLGEHGVYSILVTKQGRT